MNYVADTPVIASLVVEWPWPAARNDQQLRLADGRRRHAASLNNTSVLASELSTIGIRWLRSLPGTFGIIDRVGAAFTHGGDGRKTPRGIRTLCALRASMSSTCGVGQTSNMATMASMLRARMLAQQQLARIARRAAEAETAAAEVRPAPRPEPPAETPVETPAMTVIETPEQLRSHLRASLLTARIAATRARTTPNLRPTVTVPSKCANLPVGQPAGRRCASHCFDIRIFRCATRGGPYSRRGCRVKSMSGRLVLSNIVLLQKIAQALALVRERPGRRGEI